MYKRQNVDDYLELTFDAVSQGNSSISESVTSNTSIGIMMAETAVVGAVPGGHVSFNLEFLNPTDQTDNFSVSIESGDPGWSYEISPLNISLEGGEKGHAWINFTVPNTAEIETSYPMVINLSNTQRLDKINVIMEVLALRGAHIWSSDEKYEAYVNPEGTVYFNVRVVNYERKSINANLDYDQSKMQGWIVKFNNQSSWSKSLPADKSTSVSISATAPSSAEAIETFWLDVICSSPGFESTFFTSNITVNQQFGVSIGSISPMITILGNYTELIQVPVINIGNGPDTFEVTYSGNWVTNSTEDIYCLLYTSPSPRD